MRSNLLLDELDQELEKRGLRFCRYADDCNIYVKSRRAGARGMTSTSRFLATRLKLTVNREKSAVGSPTHRPFLGFYIGNWTNRPPNDGLLLQPSAVAGSRSGP
ncbi:MAG: hypothetical protein K1Y36_08910 [Blastocatellia bacterium]|nr:hypothetical protein [Blastocatellia bacterium]